jgi:16S rRNA processing protein RimM
MSAANDASGESVHAEWVTLALVVKTQGRLGEVAAELLTDAPSRFQVGMELSALLRDGSRRGEKIEELWPHKSWLVLKFAGVDTITDAEALKGAELQVPLSDRAELEPGFTYLSDLIGCTVFDGGREVGSIIDVAFGAGEAPLLVVASGGKLPYEIPFAEAYLEKVDVARKQVRMRLPEGLLDVNSSAAREEKARGR